MRILNRTQVDELCVEEGAGGTWVARFVDGPNASGSFVARFGAGEGGTRVEMEAFAPPGGFSFGIGKLSPFGLEKVLQKMLDEHRRAIEGYDPSVGTSATAATLGALDDLTAPIAKLAGRERRAIVAVLLEAACAVAVADDHADAEERAVLDEVARMMGGVELDDRARARLVESAERAAHKSGILVRCEQVGARLKKLGHAELGLAIAAVVAEASHGVDPPELAALQRLAAGAGVPDAALSSNHEPGGRKMAEARPSSRAVPLTKLARKPPPPLPGKQKKTT